MVNLGFKVFDDKYEKIKQAAEIDGRTIASFVRKAAVDRAKIIIKENGNT